jgi:hypothetical protein
MWRRQNDLQPERELVLSLDLDTTCSQLSKRGWTFVRKPKRFSAEGLSRSLGWSSLRPGDEAAELTPKSREASRPGTMSAIIGMDAQPMHTDGANRSLPPRFLVFECLNAGEAPCPTNIWVLNLGLLNRCKPRELQRTGWVSQHAGVRFYCDVLNKVDGLPYVRFDPLCMTHPDPELPAIASETLHRYSQLHRVDWIEGSILAIDNWRCLHARGDGGAKACSRHLKRWTIGS